MNTTRYCSEVWKKEFWRVHVPSANPRRTLEAPSMLFHWSFREPTWHNAKRRNDEFHSRLWETTCFSSSRIFFFSSLKAVAWSTGSHWFSLLPAGKNQLQKQSSELGSFLISGFPKSSCRCRNSQSCWPPKSPTRLTETAWKCSIYPLASTRNCNATSNIKQLFTSFIPFPWVLSLICCFSCGLRLVPLLRTTLVSSCISQSCCDVMVSTIGITIPPKFWL